MTHGSLFSGIGGFDLAAEWMGWENKFHCEWNVFGQKVLHHYWPNAEQFTDIKKSNFTKYANRIDILTGGFPCQPYSSAGKRLGKEDDRHLWPEMLRAIKEIQPRWIVGENVYGLVNWSGGLVFHEVQADLEAEGYEVFPYLLPAVSVNAPHRRDRIWFVAYSKCSRYGRKSEKNRPNITRSEWDILSDIGQHGNKIWSETERCSKITADTNSNDRGCLCRQKSKQSLEAHTKHCDTCSKRDATNTEHKGLERQYRERDRCTEHREDKGLFVGSENKFNVTDPCCIGLEGSIQTRINDKQGWDIQQRGKISKHIFENGAGIQFKNFPTVSPLCNGDDGISDRLDTITFSKWRTESIKAGGNAVCPQVVLQIFKSIQEYENLNQ